MKNWIVWIVLGLKFHNVRGVENQIDPEVQPASRKHFVDFSQYHLVTREDPYRVFYNEEYFFSALPRELWVSFRGIKGNPLQFSFYTPVGKTKNSINVRLHGPVSLNNTLCTGEWGRLASDPVYDGLSEMVASFEKIIGFEASELDAALLFNGTASKSPVFDPFNLMGYIPLTGCKGLFPSTGEYLLQIEVLFEDIGIMLSLGPDIQRWGFVDILTKSLVLFELYDWAKIPFYLILWPHALCFVFVCYLFLFHKDVTPWRLLTTFGSFICLASSMFFGSQLIYLASYKVPMNKEIVFPATGHLFVPLLINLILIFALVRLHETKSPPFHVIRSIFLIILGIIQFGTAWQGYIVGPAFMVLGGILSFLVRSKASGAITATSKFFLKSDVTPGALTSKFFHKNV